MTDIDVKLKSNGDYWLAYWTVPGEHRRKAKSLGNKSKLARRKAMAMCRQLALNMRLGKVSYRGNVPRLDQWLESHKADIATLREATRLEYRIAGQYLSRYFEANPRIDAITADDAANWRAALASGELSLDNKYATDPPGETTVCKHVRTVKAIFNAAVERELIPANPFRRLKGNAPSPPRDWRDVTATDMANILDACPNDSYRAMFGLCRWVGLRRDEARQLAWGDILWDKNRIMVNARVANPTTKWHKRVAPIEPRDMPTGLADLLRQWYANAPEGSQGPCWQVPKHDLYKRVQPILHQAGVVYSDPFHTLRKCWETDLSMKFPLHVVVSWLGNTFEVARKHYLRVPDDLYGDSAKAAAVTPKIVVLREGKYVAVVPH